MAPACTRHTKTRMRTTTNMIGIDMRKRRTTATTAVMCSERRSTNSAADSALSQRGRCVLVVAVVQLLCLIACCCSSTAAAFRINSIPARFHLAVAPPPLPSQCHASSSWRRIVVVAPRLEGSSNSDKVNNSETSTTSVKIREMAAFLSVAMAQSLLMSSVQDGATKDGGGGGEKSKKEKDKVTKAATAKDTTLDDLLELDAPIDGIKPAIKVEQPVMRAEGKQAVVEGLSDASFTEERRREDFLEKESSSSMHGKEGDRVVALKDEFAPEDIAIEELREDILEQETGSSMHAKEGDRVVALKDEFAPEDAVSRSATEERVLVTPQPRKDDVIVDASETKEKRVLITPPPPPSNVEAVSLEDQILLKPPEMAEDASNVAVEAVTASPSPAGIDDAAATETTNEAPRRATINASEPSSTTTPSQKVDSLQNFIPPVPAVISFAFGRPLAVMREGVPPLRPEQQRPNEEVAAMMESSPSMATTTTEKTPISESVAAASQERLQEAVVAAAPEIRETKTVVVSDNDPYGE